MRQNQYVQTRVPEFLRQKVLEGRLSEDMAQRIEFFRKTRPTERIPDESGCVPDHIEKSDLQHRILDICDNCPKNGVAAEMAKIVVEEIGSSQSLNPVFLYGNCDTGKSHLLSSIMQAASSVEALLVNTSDLSREFASRRDLDRRAELRRWLCKHDTLILEDIEACREDRGLQLELLSSIACAIENDAQVVVSSDAAPEHLEGVHPALVSLLTMGGLAPVEASSRQERVAMIQHYMESTPEELDAIRYLVEQVPENRRTLWEAAFRLAALRDQSAGPMTVRMVGDVLSELAGPSLLRISRDLRSPKRQSTSTKKFSASNGNKAERYRELIVAASSEQEQLTALEMALEDRLDELYTCDIDPDSQRTIGQVLKLVRNGKLKEATQWMLAQKEQRVESLPPGEDT